MTADSDMLRLTHELEQLNEGLHRGDLAAIEHSRRVLGSVALYATPALLCFIFDAIAESMEKQ